MPSLRPFARSPSGRRRHRKAIGSLWRRLNPGQQALLVLVYLCAALRLLSMGRSGQGRGDSRFYKWKNRIGAETPTARGEQQRAELDAEIKRLFAASGGTYGSPRITQDLRKAGWRVSENTVARRMAELGLAGRAPKKSRSLTRQGKRPAAPDLVRRRFTAVAADVLWVGDITMIHTDEGPLYLASVEDLFPRRLFGYAMSAHLHRQQQLQERLAMGEAWTDSGFVFTQPDGNRLHPQHISDQFLWLAYLAGLPPPPCQNRQR